MLSCRQNAESKNSKVVKTKTEGQCFYQTMKFKIVKSQDLLKSMNLMVY